MVNGETPSGAEVGAGQANENLASALAEIDALRGQMDDLRALLDQRAGDCDTLAELVAQMRQELESSARELTEFRLRERNGLLGRVSRTLRGLLRGGDSK